jgi:SAM-dependent methyltransferase
VTLRDAWEAEAADWIRFARAPDHFAWLFNLPAFFELIPPPGRLTVDIGCGEGRVARELKKRGHTVQAFDGSPTLVAAARDADPSIRVAVADAAALPLDDGAADLAIAFMSLQAFDDLATSIAETARILEAGGRLCAAVVHPMNSVEESPDGYFAEHRYAYDARPDGIDFTFHDTHRPLGAYFNALESAGLVVEALREPIPGPELLAARPHAERWTRTPCFLHFRAYKRG